MNRYNLSRRLTKNTSVVLSPEMLTDVLAHAQALRVPPARYMLVAAWEFFGGSTTLITNPNTTDSTTTDPTATPIPTDPTNPTKRQKAPQVPPPRPAPDTLAFAVRGLQLPNSPLPRPVRKHTLSFCYRPDNLRNTVEEYATIYMLTASAVFRRAVFEYLREFRKHTHPVFATMPTHKLKPADIQRFEDMYALVDGWGDREVPNAEQKQNILQFWKENPRAMHLPPELDPYHPLNPNNYYNPNGVLTPKPKRTRAVPTTADIAAGIAASAAKETNETNELSKLLDLD